MNSNATPWRTGHGCVIVRVRLTPKSSVDAVEGVEQTSEGPAVKARVRGKPVEGEANAALERLLADWLDAPKGTVSIVGGGKSRIKQVAIEGDPVALTKRLEAAISNSASRRVGR